MSIRRSLWAVAMGMGLVSLAFAQTQTSQTSSARIEELVKQLGSSKYVERERAQKELEAIGNPALEVLRKAAREGDLEISRRAADMVRRMEEKITTGSLLAPKKVNLKLTDVSVVDAVAELAKQSGYVVQLEGDRTALARRKITLATGEISFWEALDQLCVAAGLMEKGIANPVTFPQPIHPGIPVNPIRPPIKLRPLPAPVPGAVPNVPPAQPAKPGLLQVQAIQEVQVQVQAVQVEAQAAPLQPAKEQPAQARPVQAQAQIQVQAVPVQVQILPVQVGQGLVVARPVGPAGPQQIILVDGKAARIPTCYSGAVRIRLLSPDSLKMPKQAGETLLVFDVSPEPRMKGFQLQGNPSITKALDDMDQNLTLALDVPPGVNPPPLAVAPAQNVLWAASRNPYMGNRPMPVRLKLGEKQAKNLKELSGTLMAQVQMPPEPLIVLDSVLKGAGQTAKGKNGGAITLQSIEKTGNGEYKVQLTVENVGQNPFGGGGVFQINGNAQIQIGGVNLSATNQNTPELVDAAGKAYQVTQIPNRSLQFNNGQMRQNLTVIYRANSGQGDPAQLIVTGTRTTTVAVPFAFKNVPLP